MFSIYLKTLQEGLFEEKIRRANSLLKHCTVCPRNCGINRLAGETGECGTGAQPIFSSYFPHYGEEAPLVGSRGSGTIFIAGCNLQCIFCQNYEISHLVEGRPLSTVRFAEMMLELQETGCHNINIVTPSHIVPQLIEAVKLAAENGLNIPLVYNSGGYESRESLRLLEGIVDIYMPDFKFYEDSIAAKYTAVENYGDIVRQAVREMRRQVGDLVIEDGIATHGLLVRHLVMPGLIEDSRKIFGFLAQEISKDTYINVMQQYRPAGKAGLYPEIARPLNRAEYLEAKEAAKEAGLHRFDK